MSEGYQEMASYLLMCGGLWAILIVLAWATIFSATKIKPPRNKFKKVSK